MDKINLAINRIINAIDWSKVKSYHKKLGIFWEIENGKDTVKRLPTVGELKDELRSIIYHMYEENLSYISYGSWVIFWERNDYSIGDIRVIFRIADFHFEENTNDRKSLEEALQKAIEKEDYEYAAVIRDTLNKKQKEN
jgi:UvrB/uvrC motif